MWREGNGRGAGDHSKQTDITAGRPTSILSIHEIEQHMHGPAGVTPNRACAPNTSDASG